MSNVVWWDIISWLHLQLKQGATSYVLTLICDLNFLQSTYCKKFDKYHICNSSDFLETEICWIRQNKQFSKGWSWSITLWSNSNQSIHFSIKFLQCTVGWEGQWNFEKYKKWTKVDAWLSFKKPTEEEFLHFLRFIWPKFCSKKISWHFLKESLANFLCECSPKADFFCRMKIPTMLRKISLNSDFNWGSHHDEIGLLK